MKIKDIPSAGQDPTDDQLEQLIRAAACDARSRAAAADAALRASVDLEVEQVKDRYGLRPGALRAPVLGEDDELLAAHKRDVRRQSDAAVSAGQLQQSDVFVVKPALARKAVVKLKP